MPSTLASAGPRALGAAVAVPAAKSSCRDCRPQPRQHSSPGRLVRRRGGLLRRRAAAASGAEFDLQLAIALAGAAFESYNAPLEAVYVETALNSTETTFVSGEYINDELAGILTVRLERAEGLPAKDLWGTSDPYVTFSLGESFARSTVVEKNLDPEWNEEFRLFVRDPEEQKLMVRCFDKDVITSDDALGAAFLPAAIFCSGHEKSFTLDLGGQGGGGKVTFTLQFTPFEDVSMEEVAVAAVEGTPMLVLQAWNELATLVKPNSATEKLEPVCYVDNTDSDTQAWVLWNKRERRICVAFRGTEQTSLTDIVTDLSLVACDFDVERTTGNFFDKKSMQVHAGFMQAFDSVKVRLLSVVDSIVLDNEPGAWHVYVTGHSLGGALATLFALQLKSRSWPGGEGPEVSMYNFGSPRVGNAKFADEYNSRVTDSWRVFNKNDIVSSVPRTGNYKHVDNAVAVSEDGKIMIDGDHGIKDVLGEGQSVEELVPGLLEKGLFPSENEELKALIKQEMEILASISSGQGIMEHMEDFYLSAFQKIIASARVAVEERITKQQ